jgi:hypothetical protein
MSKKPGVSTRVVLLAVCAVVGTGCGSVQQSHAGSMACEFTDASDLARGATSLVVLSAVERGVADSAGERVATASVRLERALGGVSTGDSFAVVNPDVGDVKGVSTLRVGKRYLAYLKPWVDRNGSQVKGIWLTVGGPVGIWQQTDSGSFEPVWNDPAMTAVSAGELAGLPRPARTVAQVLASPASCP